VSVIATTLNSGLRNNLEKAVLRARAASETASRNALGVLGVEQKSLPSGLSEDDRTLRIALRAKARQLGGSPDTTEGFDALVADCAYEQWHRMLFGRFLAENGLLIHPEGVPVTIEECEELAPSFGEPDAWMLAARFASQMLPGIFRLDDPCLRVRLAPEGRQALERILAELDRPIFLAEDSLGWVYQFWQSEKNDEVNNSARKIAGADLAAVTQRFTDPYMVRFLLENTLGAWWASRHPHSSLLSKFEYLVRDETEGLAAGRFASWPDEPAELTIIDPACGSGHFLVDAFHLLRLMRMEREGLDAATAGDAVLQENLYGLELDQRCLQISAFALALAGWRSGGYRELPLPNLACVGFPARGNLDRWKASVEKKHSDGLTKAVERLHSLFADADSLGSLLNPAKDAGVGDGDDLPMLISALRDLIAEGRDPVAAVFGSAVAGAATAAELLARRYTLVTTNVPYLAVRKQDEVIRRYCERRFPEGRMDLATSFLMRLFEFCNEGGAVAAVTPQNWLTLTSYEPLRIRLLDRTCVRVVGRLGAGAFQTITGHVVKPALLVFEMDQPEEDALVFFCEADGATSIPDKQRALKGGFSPALQRDVRKTPDSRIVMPASSDAPLLSSVADSSQGMTTGDNARFMAKFWEVDLGDGQWVPLQSTVSRTQPYGGRDWAVRWENGTGRLEEYARANRARLHDAHRRGIPAWGSKGVAVSQMSNLPVTLYGGEIFDSNTAVIVPKNETDLAAIWAYCCSPEFLQHVRSIDQSLKVTNSTFLKLPFEHERWVKQAERLGDLPPPSSDDPTQWLFAGNPVGSISPLQVAVARLVGYRWPRQGPDQLDRFSDNDGIVCLPALSGERPAAERLRGALAAAYGDRWSPALLDRLLTAEGSPGKSLEEWLRDHFFASHCARFQNRPFIWHVGDGRRDGFSALLNYQRLDRRLLERLTYATLGEWLELQRRESAASGAEARLAAAVKLQDRLKLILEGEPPYDIYVRWKPLADQPLGWEPDINDGVRLNIRPFVTAAVLRSRVNVKWGKDKGKDADGSERINDLHLTLAKKRAARAEQEAA
jgi:hypothetical protein